MRYAKEHQPIQRLFGKQVVCSPPAETHAFGFHSFFFRPTFRFQRNVNGRHTFTTMMYGLSRTGPATSALSLQTTWPLEDRTRNNTNIPPVSAGRISSSIPRRPPHPHNKTPRSVHLQGGSKQLTSRGSRITRRNFFLLQVLDRPTSGQVHFSGRNILQHEIRAQCILRLIGIKH